LQRRGPEQCAAWPVPGTIQLSGLKSPARDCFIKEPFSFAVMIWTVHSVLFGRRSIHLWPAPEAYVDLTRSRRQRFSVRVRGGCRGVHAVQADHEQVHVDVARSMGAAASMLAAKARTFTIRRARSPTPSDLAHGSRRLASRFRELAAVRSVDAVSAASRPMGPLRHGKETGSRTGTLRV
jgi:hypothetical protein